MFKDRLVETVGNHLKPFYDLGPAPKGTPMRPETTDPTEGWVGLAVKEAGIELRQIHERSSHGFGWIGFTGMARYAITRELRGPYDTWDQFLLDTFDRHTHQMNEVLFKEKDTRTEWTNLTYDQRESIEFLLSRRPQVRELIENNILLKQVAPKFLHGNPYLGSIYVIDHRFSGMGDFSQMLSGDPIDDLAYFSVMPHGEVLFQQLLDGWSGENEIDPELEAKLHFYKLWQAYRKVTTRYVKHRWLGTYPEPLQIANDELAHFGIQ